MPNLEGFQAGESEGERNEHSLASARIDWKKQSVQAGTIGGIEAAEDDDRYDTFILWR